MADGNVLQGFSPATMRKQLNSSELAESLSTIVQGQGVNMLLQEGESTSSVFVEDLVKRLRSNLSDNVVKQLVAEYPANLTRMRDDVLQTVRNKSTSNWPSGKTCEKDCEVRRDYSV